MPPQALQIKNWFENQKSIIEREYQKELDKLAEEDEEKLEQIAAVFDPDDYRDNEENR